MMRASAKFSHGLYVPAGALWGGHDIQKMADRGTLKVSWSCFISIACCAGCLGVEDNNEETPFSF